MDPLILSYLTVFISKIMIQSVESNAIEGLGCLCSAFSVTPNSFKRKIE